MSEQSWINSEVDRSKWGSGDWDGEPDKVQWKDAATGLDCLAVRNSHGGNWCGYVGLPPGHALHGKDYQNIRFGPDGEYPDVHGGLTFAEECVQADHPSRGICHIPSPGQPEHLWWLGFDCAHGWDLSPGSEAFWRERHLSKIGDPNRRYRTLGYVKSECAKLAAQIVNAPSQGGTTERT